MHGYFITLSVTHRSLSYFTSIKTSDILSDETGHITIRVHPQGSHSFTCLEEDHLRRRVTTQCDTCDTWHYNLPNVREVLGTVDNHDSGDVLTHRELPNIWEVSREHRHLSSVTYWVFINLPDIRKVLWNGLTSEFGHLSGVGRITEHPVGFSKVPTFDFGHLSRIGKPAEHPRSFTIGTVVTGTTFCIHSSHLFAELCGSTHKTSVANRKSNPRKRRPEPAG